MIAVIAVNDLIDAAPTFRTGRDGSLGGCEKRRQHSQRVRATLAVLKRHLESAHLTVKESVVTPSPGVG